MNYQDHDNESDATGRINKRLNKLTEERPNIDTATARLIAACLHAGPSTALHQFASTGQLDRTAAVSEIEWGQGHATWREALRRYLAH